MTTLIENGQVFLHDRFVNANVIIKDTKIIQAGKRREDTDNVIDATGKYIVPGFIDIHIHGAAGYGFCDENAEGLDKMSEYLAYQGVTGYLGTAMSYSEEQLLKIFDFGAQYMREARPGKSAIHGFYMEGPFSSRDKKGALSQSRLVNLNLHMFMRLYEIADKNIKIVTVVPELPGAMGFIRTAADYAQISIAHTETDYETAIKAYKAGASHLTHIFNANPTYSHRKPGVIGAAADMGSTVEVISDGVHIHPSVVRGIFKLFGKEKVCLVSDGIRAGGMPDGEYELGGKKVTLKNAKVTLEDGTLAGSGAVLSECVSRAISFGVPPEDVIHSATVTPAKKIGVYNNVGSIDTGKRADILFLNHKFQVENVMLEGEMIR